MTVESAPPTTQPPPVPEGLRRAVRLFASVRLPWLLILPLLAAGFPTAHGANAMPPLDGPGWARAWMRWDSGWYVRVVRDGYVASGCGTPGAACEQASIAFLPAYPFAVRGLMALGFPLTVASFLLNAVALLLALWGLHRLTSRLLGEQIAARAVWAMLAFPTTLFFSAGYAEALFAAASIWGAVAYLENKAALFAPCMALAALGRPHGLVLVACLVAGALVRRRWALGIGAGLLVALSFGAYLFWQHQQFGDALAFLHARKAWGLQGDAFSTLRNYWVSSVRDGNLMGFQDVAAGILLAVTSIFAFRRMGPEWGAYCLLLLILPLSQGQIWGMSRAVLGAFPVFLLCAQIPERARLAAMALSISLASANALIFISGRFVA